MAKTPSDFDKLRQFLEMDRKVLRFYCMLDDRDRLFGQFKKFILHVRRVTLHSLLDIHVCKLVIIHQFQQAGWFRGCV